MRLQNQNDVEFKSNFQLFQSQGQQSRLKFETVKFSWFSHPISKQLPLTGLKITAGQRTMSGLIMDLTGQTLVLPVILTGHCWMRTFYNIFLIVVA